MDRHTWAVELLDLRPSHRVLEVGCGPGVATGLVAPRLTTGTVVGIDRSATAIGRAAARHPAIRFEQTTVEALDAPDGSFDVAFAVNVNLFWTTDAAAECTALRRLLAPAGPLHMVYEPPPDRAADLGDRVAATLSAQGWHAVVVPGPRPDLLAVSARPA